MSSEYGIISAKPIFVEYKVKMEQPNSRQKEKEINIDEVPYHSDKEMLIHVGVKFVLVFALIMSFDLLIDLALMILDFIFEILHILIEIIDEMLESYLKEKLSTSHQQTEAIIVNVALIIVILIIYKIFHGLRFIYRLKKHLKADWLSYKKRQSLSWQLLPFMSKIKLLTAYCIGFSLLFFLAF